MEGVTQRVKYILNLATSYFHSTTYRSDTTDCLGKVRILEHPSPPKKISVADTECQTHSKTSQNVLIYT